MSNNTVNKFIMPNGDEIKIDSGSGLELCDICMALYVDETKGLRRYLNGQIVDINANTQAFLDRLKQIQTTNPDYFTTEDNWQAEALLNIDGCVYKFVFNYAEDGETVISVRLPKYPDYVEVNTINGTAPVSVYGNGMSLGLTNNTGLTLRNTNACFEPRRSAYGINAGTTLTDDASDRGPVKLTYGLSFDPSKSGIVGTAKLSTSQTKFKLRYFIQIATGSETENNIINEIELNNPYSLFDSKYSDHELNNLSWLKSEGQWNAKSVYPTAYDKLLKVYNGTETVEGLSVKLSTETYTDYDFVLNTADETFRLPLLDGSEDLPSDRYDDLELKENGTTYTAPANGWYQLTKKTNNSQYVAIFNKSNSMGVRSAINDGNASTFCPVKKCDTVSLSYTASGATLTFRFIYARGNGSLYYYVGETVQNANLIDAGRIGEILPTKTDKVQAAQASMPSNKYIDLTIGANGTTYTAPANGWYNLRGTTTSNQGYIELILNIGMNALSQSTSYMSNAIIVPVKKGQVVTLSYNNATITRFIFLYAEGEV